MSRVILFAERQKTMFDNLIMSEIKNDIISFLPAGAPYHETSIMALWKNLHLDGDYVPPRGKFKNKEYELKCSEHIKAIIRGMSFDNLILVSTNVISRPMELLQFLKKGVGKITQIMLQT